MKDVSHRQTSGAADFVPSGRRTKLVRAVLDRAAYFVLLGIVASVSQMALAEDPRELFAKTCAPCHGKDGKAETPAAKKLGVKDLSQSKLTDAQIVQQIMEGKKDEQGRSKMPAFNEKLTSEQVQSLVSVVKEFRK
jgi:mono/diheme cytochrome c family protein